MSLKTFVFRLLGKDPEAVVVTFLSGPEPLASAMLREVVSLAPDREHYAVTTDPAPSVPGVRFLNWNNLEPLRRKRIGLAPALFTQDRQYQALRRLALRLAPGKILAYNERLERHHLRFRTALASWLFLRGVPLDRIYLRPGWLFPWKRDRSVHSTEFEVREGRPVSDARARVAILTPYFPYPLSHGGAVRIFHLLREAARDFDVFLFSFAEAIRGDHLAPVLELCAKVALVPVTRYREPRWSTLSPPEVAEFRSPVMRLLLREIRREHAISLLQVEYTQMASYGGDVLVEHDVTFDLYRQIHERENTRGSWWNYWRWLRYERRSVRRFPRVVAMSQKDAALLQGPHVRVIPNGVDLDRFSPEPETSGQRLLFIGSFRHFPNILAYRFLTEEIWPRLTARLPNARLTVVAGYDPELYWSEHAGGARLLEDASIERLAFVADVRPLYAAANLVVVPTTVSAGTNLKVLEALAMERAVVSTSSGCAGLDLEHVSNVWIADAADEFCEGVVRLLADEGTRRRIAEAGRQHAERYFDWQAIGVRQKRLWQELLRPQAILIRRGAPGDFPALDALQAAAPEAAQWETESYRMYDVLVAEDGSDVAGFLASRTVAPDEIEILNLAVAPRHRRRGIASRLIRELGASQVFLEVRVSNSAAREFYRKAGFTEAGIRKHYYDSPLEDAIVMRLSRKLNHANFTSVTSRPRS